MEDFNKYLADYKKTDEYRDMLKLDVEGIGSDPLAEPYLDDLNLRILENYAGFVFSKKGAKDWEIVIQM